MINLKNEITAIDAGDYMLRGKHYKNEIFDTFAIPTIGSKKLIIADTTFEYCKTINGFFFTENYILKNVSFIDFDCGDALHINAETQMENVKVSGKKPGMLWIRPTNKIPRINGNSQTPIIDVSEFEGNLSITGIPLNGIFYNSERHIPLKSDLFDGIDWGALKLGPANYWRLMLRKLISDGVVEGLFSLPPPSDKSHARALQELEILKTHGCIH